MNLSKFGIYEYLANVFNNETEGFYLDFGAGDGAYESATYLLYQNFGWRGICSERSIKKYNELCKNRLGINIHGLLSKTCCMVLEEKNSPSESNLSNNSSIKSYEKRFTFYDILPHLSRTIDYCSITAFDIGFFEDLKIAPIIHDMDISVFSILNIQQHIRVYDFFYAMDYIYINQIAGFDFFLKNQV